VVLLDEAEIGEMMLDLFVRELEVFTEIDRLFWHKDAHYDGGAV
jgi:hypothetical protein